MTLVYRESKVPAQQQEPLRGPGCYNPVLPSQAQPHHACIFASKTKRQLAMREMGSCELGPGSYDPDLLHSRKGQNTSAVFRSQEKRFHAQQAQAEQEDGEKIKGLTQALMLAKDKKTNTGKLYKVSNYDSISPHKAPPSIPSIEQSYGYRIDHRDNRLVQNENPNILLARENLMRTQMESLYNGPGSHFLQQNKSRGLKWVQEAKVASEIKSLYHRNMSPTNSDSEDHAETGKENNPNSWQGKGNLLVSRQPRFNYQKIINKQKLQLNAIKRKYERFFGREEIEKAINYKKRMQSKVKHGKFNAECVVECFMSKQQRFKGVYDHVLPESDAPQLEKHQSEFINSQAGQKTSQVAFNCKVPRFNDSLLTQSKLGPGQYSNSSSIQKSRGSCWVSAKLERFKQLQLPDSPGPGQYQIAGNSNRQSSKFKFRQNNVKIRSRFIRNPSCEDESWKALSNCGKVTQENRDEKKQDLSPKHSLHKSAKIIKQMKSVVSGFIKTNHSTSVEEKSENAKEVQKYQKPPTVYHPIKKSLPSPGPGHFEVRRELDKKTFNVTYE